MAIDPHILNLYEALDLRLSDLVSIAHDAFTGNLIDPIEKVDGQNFTFTVNGGGHVRFIGKGCPSWTVSQGGISIDEVVNHFSDKPVIAATFKESLTAIQNAVDQDPGSFIKACLGGKRFINSEVITPASTNVIKYNASMVCLHGLIPGDLEAFQALCKCLPKVTNGGWQVMPPPIPRFIQRDDVKQRIDFISMLIDKLKTEQRLVGDPTIGAVNQQLLVGKLATECASFLGVHQIIPAALRLLLEEAKHLKRSDFKSSASWTKFKALDDDRTKFVGNALIPIERMTVVLGSFALDSYEFQVADGDEEVAKEHRDCIRNIRKAMKHARVQASPEIKEKIELALNRTMENYFTKNVEGIVFTWKSQRLKLSGAFPGINRVKGYFKYGLDPARMIDGR